MDIQQTYAALHERCLQIGTESLSESNRSLIASNHQFAIDLALWMSILGERTETAILRMLASEFQYALVSLTLGFYRQAFKGLRLTLELGLQMVQLSGNELELREWLQGRKDTVWTTLVDPENGVFSLRFARAFLPHVAPHMKQHNTLASQLYRECSECVHGNLPKRIPIPDSLRYSEECFKLWNTKAELVAKLIHMAMSVRYLSDLKASQLSTLEPMLLSHLGYIAELRTTFGGQTGG